MQSINYGQNIAHIDELFLSMASSVENAVRKASHAMKTQDQELAKEVKKGDTMIDGLQQAIEDIVVETIATQQPVASDLRQLMSRRSSPPISSGRGIMPSISRERDEVFFINDRHGGSLKSLRRWRKPEMRHDTANGESLCRQRRGPSLAAPRPSMTAIDHTHKALSQGSLDLSSAITEQAEQASKI